MRLRATICALLLVVTAQVSRAQTDVTVRQINAIPQAGIDAVKALGSNLTAADITTNIRSTLLGTKVRFTSVVISDPRYSGLSSVNATTGVPSRIHFFVRDVSAATDGPAGNDIQVVDGNYLTSGSLGLFVGDVITMVGDLAYFGTGVQFSPESIQVEGTISDKGLPASILDPVVVTIDQINRVTGDLKVQANWDNFSALNQQYVRIEGVQVWQSPNRTDTRPNWILRDAATGALIQNDDISLAFRNDRSDYPTDFLASNNFTAPPAGATVTVQGFALLRSNFDPLQIGDPADALMKIVPWQPSDLVVTASPPNITSLTGPSTVPGNGPVHVTANVEADPARTVTGVEVSYTSTSSPTPATVTGTNTSGNDWSFEIPAQADGDFVTWVVIATDSEGAVSESASQGYRVLYDGIRMISDIQQTADGGYGPSPFSGLTVDMDLTVTLMTDPAHAGTSSNDIVAVQDGTGPWSGIGLYNSGTPYASLTPGATIHITSAQIRENFEFTQLRNVTFDVVSTSGTVLDPVVITTDALTDRAIAESYEGMFVRFENVVVTTTNADGPTSNFGEFAVSTDGTAANAIRVNDQSRGTDYGGDAGTIVADGQRLEFVQGSFWYSFNNFKLEPRTLADIGPVTNTAIADLDVPTTTILHQNYPNPFNPVTSIRYDVVSAGQVTLNVFDVTGRLVKTLHSGMQVPGSHSVSFDGSGLSSGTYFVRLATPDATLTRAMTLLK